MKSSFEFPEQFYKTNNYSDYLSREVKYRSIVFELRPILNSLGITNILDFGCSVGFLVKHLNLLGFKCLGYDCSEWAVGYGRNFVTDELTFNSGAVTEEYNLVVFLDVLEHNDLSIVKQILETVRSKYILVKIPVRIVGEDDFFLEVSRRDETHITCFTVSEWRGLFATYGFKEFRLMKGDTLYNSQGVYCAILQKADLF